MTRAQRLLARPWALSILVAALVAVAAGLYWFQPWQLVVNETVQEDVPAAAPLPSPASPSSPQAAPAELATGTLISHEHQTTGTVRILRAADGSLVLRLENLDTSSGPDVHVWLTDAPVKPGKDGWNVFDDGRYLDTGKLKGNKGNQNYPLPVGTDLSAYTSVSIWCDRFDVSFGAAELSRQPA
ncbi:DM13 domain-containing protein [Amycolatopsis sp. OK19-0408]|uniref:DM13 domain-containing protein n=1 Tax=Amycolatopsis iheyensis TaxID=2945988 RepID=A0A9X2NLU6_9PSEU|nr:DM13 domain-containing protein [Amycolatopsis iheyensis]MCR6489798.1 DM13 domain-containing protein [Amycolatopsis iheyensis]